MVRICFFSLLAVFIAANVHQNVANAQKFSTNFDLGIGAQDSTEVLNLSLGIGATFFDFLYVSLGFDQEKYLQNDGPYEKNFSDYKLYASVRPNITLYYNDEKDVGFGIFPEVYGYLNPKLPQKIEYEGPGNRTITKTGPKQSQFAYALGGGIFMERKNGYLALKYRVSNADAFEAIRTLDVPPGLPSGKVHIIGISFFFINNE